MTMFSPEVDSRQLLYGSSSGSYGGNIYDHHLSCIGSDLVLKTKMTEDETRTTSLNNNEAAPTEGSEDRDEGWLQLSIGGSGGGGGSVSTGGNSGPSHVGITQGFSREETPRRDGPGLVELDLLPSSSSRVEPQTRPLGLVALPEFRPPRPVSNFPSTAPGFSPFLHHIGNSSTPNFYQSQELNWGFRPVGPINLTSASSSSSSPSFSSGSYFPRPTFQLYPGLDFAPAGPRPGLDFRVIPPPRRPHSGIWFMLQASKNQEKEPYLPQVSKSYLRIKDGKMTVRLVMKYLVNKLSLENESEVEITCRGQRLQPFLTLQHVRDNIWITNRDSNTYITLLPNSSTIDHIMVLNYSRTNPSN